MSASAIGWIAAGFIVAISSALVMRHRQLPRYGQAQGYSNAARVLMLACALLFIVGSLVIFLNAPVKDSTVWIGTIGCFSLGIGALIGLYYYLRFSVTVLPESITVTDPWRGTVQITADNLVSTTDTRFKGAKQTTFVFRDGEKQRSLTLSHRVVELNAAFYKSEAEAFHDLRRYVDAFAKNRDNYSVHEGMIDDGLVIESVHGLYRVYFKEQGRRHYEVWFGNNLPSAMSFFVRKFESLEGTEQAGSAT